LSVGLERSVLELIQKEESRHVLKEFANHRSLREKEDKWIITWWTAPLVEFQGLK
jgi:hypothetical protein